MSGGVDDENNRHRFEISGPSHLTVVDWANENDCRCVVACLIKGIYVLELDRLNNRKGSNSLAYPWWEFFHFRLIDVLVDDDDDDPSIFGALFEYWPPVFGLKHSSTTKAASPIFVIAFRGSNFEEDPNSKHMYSYKGIKEKFSSYGSRLDLAMKTVNSILPIFVDRKVWIVGHSVGCSFGLLAGETMIDSGVFPPTFLFNPPFFTPSTINIWKKRQLDRDIKKTALTKLMKKETYRKKSDDRFIRLSPWFPSFFVHPADPICSKYIGYFEDGRNTLETGAVNMEMQTELLHLVPSACLTTNQSPAISLAQAHQIEQWWRDLPLLSRIYQVGKEPAPLHMDSSAGLTVTKFSREFDQLQKKDMHLQSNMPDLDEDTRNGYSFQFCYLFPRNYEFYKDDIVQMWETELLTDAESKFMEFEQKLIIKFSRYDHSARQPMFKVNDWVVDLLEHDHHDDFIKFDATGNKVPQNSRHASIRDPDALIQLSQCRNLLTLLLLHQRESNIDQVPHSLFQELPMLVCLDLSYTRIKELPSTIVYLQYLKYLNLSYTPISTLPNSLCDIPRMQTLKLRCCSKLLGLPRSMRKLINIRHVDVDVSCLLISMPPGLGDLEHLQTLPVFVTGREDGYRITELNRLNSLRGSLQISSIENVLSSDEAKMAGIDQKKDLRKLQLQWTRLQDGFQVLENLQPHKNISELHIVGYCSSTYPSWFGDPSFTSLTTITIHSNRKVELLPSLGMLPRLQFLHISDMNEVVRMDLTQNVRHAFPSLEVLTFTGMAKLEKWIGVMNDDFPALQKLNMSCCPNFTALPELSVLMSLQQLEISLFPSLESLPKEGLPASLQSLVIIDCPLLKDQIRKDNGQELAKFAHIPNVRIDYEQFLQSHFTSEDVVHTLRNNDSIVRRRNQREVDGGGQPVDQEEPIVNSFGGTLKSIITMARLNWIIIPDFCRRTLLDLSNISRWSILVLLLVSVISAITWSIILPWALKSDSLGASISKFLMVSGGLVTSAYAIFSWRTLKYMYQLLQKKLRGSHIGTAVVIICIYLLACKISEFQQQFLNIPRSAL